MGRILYNETIKVDLDIHDEWLSWMKSKHILDIMSTNMFESYKILKILSQDESDGITYSIQYICPDMKTLHKYTVGKGSQLQSEHQSRYKGKYVSFQTLLEIVE